jgi:ABC-type polysaccharide/polyol phosphate export permease
VASLNVYFRDIEHILSIGLTAWFFLTPVIYEISLVTEKFGHVIRWAFFANPMTGLVTAYRAVLVSESIPSVGLLALSFALAWIVPLVGIAVFQKLQVKFADVL